MFDITSIFLILLALAVFFEPAFIDIFHPPIQQPLHVILGIPPMADIGAEFSLFLQRVEASSPISISPINEAITPEPCAMIKDPPETPKQKTKMSYRQPGRLISHTGRYHVRFISNCGRKTKALKVASQIVTEVDTLHAAVHRLKQQCISSTDDVVVARSVEITSSHKATTSVNPMAIIGDTSATSVEETTTIHDSLGAKDISVGAVTTVAASITVDGVAANGDITIVTPCTTSNAVKTVENTVAHKVTTGVNAITIFNETLSVSSATSVEETTIIRGNLSAKDMDVDAVTTDEASITGVNTITIVDQTLMVSVPSAPHVDKTTIMQGSDSAKDISVGSVTTIHAANTVEANTTVDVVNADDSINDAKDLDTYKTVQAVPAVDAVDIIEAINTSTGITTGDSTSPIESVKSSNLINTAKKLITAIFGPNKDAVSPNAVPLDLSTKFDEGVTTAHNEVKILAGMEWHSIKSTTETINKASNDVHVASGFKALENANDVVAHCSKSIDHVKKNRTKSQDVSTPVVHILSSEVSVVSPPTSTVPVCLVLSPPLTPRMVRKESISPTSDSSLRADSVSPAGTPSTPGFVNCGIQTKDPSQPIKRHNGTQKSISPKCGNPSLPTNLLTPPSTPPGVGFLDASVQTKGSKHHKNTPRPEHTSGVIKKLIELPKILTPPSTPGATDDDVRMWGRGCSPCFNADVHKAEMSCDAIEEAWLNRRLGASIYKWQKAAWWTPEERRARAFNWGMRRTINPEVRANIYVIPEDISFAVDDELDLPCGSSVCSSSDGGSSQESLDSEEEWEMSRAGIKAELKIYGL